MFNKYKKKILLILTLVFLFNFSFGYKRAEASVIAAAGIGLGVVLLAAAGVAITSPQMAQDLGGRLWNGLKEVVEVPKKIGDFFKVQITGAMLEFTAKWLNKEDSIPTSPTETTITKPITFPTEMFSYYNSYKDGYYNTIISSDIGVSKGDEFTVVYTIDGQKNTFTRTIPQNSDRLIFQVFKNAYSQNFVLDVNGVQTSWSSYDTRTIDYRIDSFSLKSVPLTGETEQKVTIPYTPQVGAGASTDKLTTSLPVGSTVTYPKDLTTNFPATQDKPISNVTDIPGVHVDTNVNTETGVIEGTLTNIAELLQSLVNFVTNIFVPPVDDLVPLDLSPLYFGITDKFPFSVPFDLIKTFQNMTDSSRAPKFEVKFPEKYFGSYTFVIDFEQFNDFVLILRYFLLLSFIVFLILQTRNIIGG